MKRHKIVCGLLCLVMFAFCVNAQTSKTGSATNFEFVNQNIRDILYALSTYTKIPIVADDTVSGTAVFQFAGGNFDRAFDTFLSSNRLFVDKTAEVWTVSRIKIAINDNDLITIDALDVSPFQLIERLSMKTNKTIIQDVLPSMKMSIHITDLPLFDAVEIIMKSYSDYTVVNTDKYIQVKKNINQPATIVSIATGNIKIRESGGLYEVSGEKAKLGDILNSFFSFTKKEYSSFARSDQVIERIGFSGKTFDESLELILEQASAEFAEINGVWYVFPIQQTDVMKKLRDEGKVWNKFDLKYLNSKDCISLVQSRFPGTTSILFPNGTSILLYTNEENRMEIQKYIKDIDAQVKSNPIQLKYIKTEDFFKALPPSVKKEDLIDAGNGNTFFFLGTDEKRAQLLQDLDVIDKPYKRIRYDLLIVQSQDTSDLNWGTNMDATRMSPGDMSMVTGSLGKLLSLNFDVITVFGYLFAAKMNVALAENQANIFADTTLYGLSGQEIKFQNTNTYRYRDYNIDAASGKTVYTGITRELTSGLVLNINGWVSGDGMITSTVTASVSKRGADVSSSAGNPPPTSEKIITTHVRSRSGETIVLSGLRQNDSTIVQSRTPFISKIPLIGWLFKNSDTSKENTQMVIYLVPHIDLGSNEMDSGLRTESMYTRLVVPYLGEKK